jgi:3-phosphoshikimate 1-carboxyvinyltransferase
MFEIVSQPKKIEGSIALPGDKSISHRVAIVSAMARGTSRIKNYSTSIDCSSTIECLKELGVPVSINSNDTCEISIEGQSSLLREPKGILNAGNSGTTMRLLAGVLCGQPFPSIIAGDSSLSNRPMDRIINPLRLMGANISGQQRKFIPPIRIVGRQLEGIDYHMPIASAQIKSCILLAGLFAHGETQIHEPSQSRDHTERMLKSLGINISIANDGIKLKPAAYKNANFDIPGDLSSAAFWLVAGAIHPNANITIKNVGVNPTRTGILDVLSEMGAKIDIHNIRHDDWEPHADISIESSELSGVEISGNMIPRVIDELPVLAVAACFANGTSIIRDASELRVKESDRISGVTEELSKLGADIKESDDGIVINGKSTISKGLTGGNVDSRSDHRLAMALTVAGLASRGVTTISESQSVSISYPSFFEDLKTLTT